MKIYVYKKDIYRSKLHICSYELANIEQKILERSDKMRNLYLNLTLKLLYVESNPGGALAGGLT